MIGKSCLVVLLLFSSASIAVGQVLKLEGVLVISVNGENQAALLDPATYKVLARMPSGVNPHDIAVSTDGRYAYIAVMGTPQEPGHSVTVLDLGRHIVKTAIELNPYNRCHDLKLSRNGARLWATCAPSKAVIEIDTRSGRIIRNWKLDQDGAWMLRRQQRLQVWRLHMSSNQTGKLLRAAPYFPVSDVERSVTFYEQTLGFRCEYSAGTPLQFAICSRDGLAIMLRRVSAPELITPNEKQGGTWDAFFWINDAQALHSEFNARGADVVYGPLIQEAYQMKEFAIRDCDGHVLGFGQSLT